MTIARQTVQSYKAGSQPPRRLTWPLLLALYGIFLWRTPYNLKSFPLYVVDWALPVAGLGVWAVLRWRRRSPWPHTALDAPLLAWLAVVILSTFFSVRPRNSLHGAWEALTWVLILGVLVDAVRRRWSGELWQALYLVGGVVCLLAFTEIVAWYLGWPLLSGFEQGWPAIGGLADPIPPVLHRLSFPLVYATVLSAFLALLIPPAICLLVARRDRSARLGMGLWLLGAAVVLFLSLSRGGFLALGASLPLLLLGATRSPQFRRRWSRLPKGSAQALVVGAVLAALLIAVALGFLLTVRLAEHRSGDDVRMDLWRSALAMFRDHPLTGVGYAAFGDALRLYRDPLAARDQITAAHNLYLNVAAEMGLAGLLVLAWLSFALVRAWWRRWKMMPAGSMAWWRTLGIGAALGGLAVQSVAETFVQPAVLLPTLFFVAQILEPVPAHGEGEEGQPRRWAWVAVLALLATAAAGLAWDTWGYARFLRGVAWTGRGEVAQALSATELARRHDPGMPLYSCQAGYLYGLQATEQDGAALAAALARYDECLSKMPAPGWLDQLNAAALLWQRRAQAEAQDLVRQATARTPLEWLPWLNRGLWAEQAGQQAEAIDSYGWVLALDPALAGSPFWSQGNRASWWDDILAAGEKTVERFAPGQTAWRWQVLVAAGRWDEAIGEIEGWLIAHPQDAEAMAWLGEALLGKGRPSEALDRLDRAIAAGPPFAHRYLVRGEAKLALGRYDEADRDLRIALFLAPEPRIHLALARLALETGKQQEARQEYARAQRFLAIPQVYSLALYRRASWLAPLPQVARIGYRQDGEAALEWGRLLEQQGDGAAAQRVYQMALALDPYLDQVRSRLAEGDRP